MTLYTIKLISDFCLLFYAPVFPIHSPSFAQSFPFRREAEVPALPGKAGIDTAHAAEKTPTMRHLVFLVCLLALPGATFAQPINLHNREALHLHKVVANSAFHEGRKALRVTEAAEFRDSSPDKLVVIKGLDFTNGVIEVDVAGRPAPGAPEGARGFIGVAFHINKEISKYELIYLRPTNGRSNDQLRRNHSTQYVSHPEFTWRILRESAPGKYESYVDLVPGAWTRVKIEVSGTKARLFVHGAEQPALIVNDLKRGETNGAIALRIGPGTEGFFSNLRVKKIP